MISYVIPTHNRPERLAKTLRAIAELGDHGACSGAEVVVVDNASDKPACAGPLASGVPVRVVRLEKNIGAAARNIGVHASDPGSAWIVMLDDDSYPADLAFTRTLARVHADILAVSADIRLPRLRRRESGGLPEVFIGCGVAIRREAFLQSGGYDASFHYYVEEYDLAARLMLAGGRVLFDPSFHVQHHKDVEGRDFGVIVSRLVRNNGWVAQRYAPEEARREELREVRRRYRAIAEKEDAVRGFATGLVELKSTLRQQARAPLSRDLWDRFTGLSHAREAIHASWKRQPFRTAAVVEEGKNAWAARQAIEECGVHLADERDAQALVIGTMSPGPMLDARERRGKVDLEGRRVIAPWFVADGWRELRRAG